MKLNDVHEIVIQAFNEQNGKAYLGLNTRGVINLKLHGENMDFENVKGFILNNPNPKVNFLLEQIQEFYIQKHLRQLKRFDSKSLLILPEEGFRRIAFHFQGKCICRTQKFNLFGLHHKIAFSFFHPTKNYPIEDFFAFQKTLTNMGIPQTFTLFFIGENQMQKRYIHQLKNPAYAKAKSLYISIG